MTIRSFLLIGLVCAWACTGPAYAAESYDNCTGVIASLPTVISTPGTWCLKQDLNSAISSGHAITIATSNVTLDCNDFKLDGLSAGTATQADAIYALNRLNVTVRQCHVRGFYRGLLLDGSGGGGHVVEGNRFEGNTYQGLQVQGDGSVVQHNRVLDTGGSTIAAQPIGIRTVYSVDILDNTVVGVVARSGGNNNATGIYADANSDASVNGNRVRGLLAAGFGSVMAIRASSDGLGHVALRDNDLVGNGTDGSVGLYCDPGDRVKDNLIGGFKVPTVGCDDAGGNYANP